MKDSTRELKITRTFNALRELVWNMWTEPEQVRKWWGPQGFTCPVAKIDFRVGGKYLYCMRGQAGPGQPVMDFWSGGTYKEIIPFEKIVCTDGFSNEHGDVISPVEYGMDPDFPKENIVTVTFETLDGKTALTIRYVAESDKVLEAMLKVQMKEGWESSLEKLAESVE